MIPEPVQEDVVMFMRQTSQGGSFDVTSAAVTSVDILLIYFLCVHLASTFCSVFPVVVVI